MEYADLLLLHHMLWNSIEVIGRVRQVVNEALFADVEAGLQSLEKNLEQCLKPVPAADATEERILSYTIISTTT